MNTLTWEINPPLGGSPRWYLDGEPLHAGYGVELRGVDYRWHPARIESKDGGRVLTLFIAGPDGCSYGRVIAAANEREPESLVVRMNLRWPRSAERSA